MSITQADIDAQKRIAATRYVVRVFSVLAALILGIAATHPQGLPQGAAHLAWSALGVVLLVGYIAIPETLWRTKQLVVENKVQSDWAEPVERALKRLSFLGFLGRLVAGPIVSVDAYLEIGRRREIDIQDGWAKQYPEVARYLADIAPQNRPLTGLDVNEMKRLISGSQFFVDIYERKPA